MMHPWHKLIAIGIRALPPLSGLAATLLLARQTARLMGRVELKECAELGEGSTERSRLWLAAISNQHTAPGGRLLGRLEALVLFASLWVGSAAAVGGWLAFKLATKWEAWTNIVVPDGNVLKPFGEDEIRNLWARHRWGVWLLRRFLIGTLWNIVSAGAGVLFGRFVAALIAP